MKENMSAATKSFLSVLLVDFMSFFLFLSFTVIAVGVSTENIGYVAYAVNSEGTSEELYTYYYSDGDDTRLEEYKAQGVEIKTQNIRSTVSDSVNNLVKIITFLFTLVMFFAMIYSSLWTRGDKDNNLAAFGHIKRDKFRGLKIGILADVPFLLLYLLLAANKIHEFIPSYSAVYRTFNYYMLPIVDAAFGAAKTAGELSVGGFLLLLVTLLPLPLVCSFGYYCGNNEISLRDRFIYAKDKEKK